MGSRPRSHTSYAKWELELTHQGPRLTAHFGPHSFDHYAGTLEHLRRAHLGFDDNAYGNEGYILMKDRHEIGRFLDKKKSSDLTIHIAKADAALLRTAESYALMGRTEAAPLPLHALDWVSTDGPGGQQLLFGGGDHFRLRSDAAPEAAGALRELVSRRLLGEKEAAALYLNAMDEAAKSGAFHLECTLPDAANAEAKRLIERKNPASMGIALPAGVQFHEGTRFVELLRDHLLVESGVASRASGALWPGDLSRVRVGGSVLASMSDASKALIAASPEEGKHPAAEAVRRR